MAEIVNLRRARKARDRLAATAGADAKRALHGRTRAEAMRDTQTAERLARTLDGARRDGGDGGDP